MKTMFARFLSVAVVAGVILGLTPARADYHDWRTDIIHPPAAPTLLWSDPDNWHPSEVPASGDTLRFELRDIDVVGPIVMDVDYSGGGLAWARFSGSETVYIQNYLKITDTSMALQIQNGTLGGAYVRVDPSGTIWGTVNCANEGARTPPTLDFAGGHWVAGNLKTESGNRQGGIIKVSSRSSTITPGYISVGTAPEPVANRPRFYFVLDSIGVSPINLQDADPIRFTGGAAGTNPFTLTVDTTAYTGPAVSIPLFIFSASSTETDRMFDPANITINQTTPGEWAVTQSDTGVTLERAGGAATSGTLIIGR